jgi:hypothetical protein
LDEFGPSGRRNGLVKGEVVLLVEGAATDTNSLLMAAAAAASSTAPAAAAEAEQQPASTAAASSSVPASRRGILVSALAVLHKVYMHAGCRFHWCTNPSTTNHM